MSINLNAAKNAVGHTALIMAAGTGGHIMPGLAIAHALMAKTDAAWTVHWLGTTHGMENRLVSDPAITLHRLNFKGLRGKGALGLVKGLAQGLVSLFTSIKLLRTIKPAVVVGMGGYVCLPGALAAKRCGVPLVLVNADADLLLSNQSLARWAKAVCCGFDGSAAKLQNATVTGNPIRNELLSLAPYAQRRAAQADQRLHMLVMGGSLGAQAINRVLPEAMAMFDATKRPMIVHQAGAAHVDSLRSRYQANQVQAEVVPFIDDIAHAISQADLVICRAGAITLSELAATGTPSVLIPFIASTTGHQVGNAQYFEAMGAAIHAPEAQLSARSLYEQLSSLQSAQLQRMSQAAYQIAKPNATQAVLDQMMKHYATTDLHSHA